MTAVLQSNLSRVNSTSSVPSRSGYPIPPVSQPRPSLTDDFEKWFTDAAPNNRMLLALKSGIDTEISWALDRICRLCPNEQFVLSAIPGLADVLFEWPEWFVCTGWVEIVRMGTLFSLPPTLERRRRHSLEALFILRNCAMNPLNAKDLAGHLRARDLILCALHRLPHDNDINSEFLLHTVEFMQALSDELVLAPPNAPYLANPLPPLQNFAAASSNRPMIIACLSTLNLLMSNPANVAHLSADSPALDAALRYLPLFMDKPLQEASLNYLYTHLSHPPMTKAFLLHPRMTATLKVLVTVLLSEQVEETVSIDITGSIYTAPAEIVITKNHELTTEELDGLIAMLEPQRCYQWMRTMFEPSSQGELTQVEFWNLYKDLFSQYQERCPPLVASEVIKYVSVVFPQALAMVLPGPPQKFVIRGVTRRQDKVTENKYRCCWDHSQCPAAPLASTRELYDHIVTEHLNNNDNEEVRCTWATCSRSPVPKKHIRSHVLTHLPTAQPSPAQSSETEMVTLPSEGYPQPIPDPTVRPPPPAHSAAITYQQAVVDPPSNSLTALLCLRILFRAAFASSDAAPRVDEDHFGFPGLIEDTDDQDGPEERGSGTDAEKKGERRGRKGFIGIRHLLERVTIRNETLMGWVDEMVDAGIMGTT